MAVSCSGLDELLKNFDDGVNKIVGNQGYELSGGQRKRIGIARVLAGRPKIVIFDETTTALQEGLEYKVINSLRDRYLGVTIIVVTHRVGMAGYADNVVLLDQGKLVGSGKYDELFDAISNLTSYK